jgi:hypothetical protein
MQSAETQPSTCHKLAQHLLRRALKQFHNLLFISLGVYVNNLNVTAVDGGLQSLQHVQVQPENLDEYVEFSAKRKVQI